MAKYYRQHIDDVTHPQKPPIGPLAGNKLAKESRIRGAFRGQDKVPALGRRVLTSQCLRGETVWLVPDIDPDAVAQTHPTATDERPVSRCYVNVTPGHFLQLSVLCIPSGATQVNIGAGDWDGDGVQGQIGINVTWTDQAATTSATSTQTILPSSPLPFGAANPDPWSGAKVRKINLHHPSIGTNGKLTQWTQHVSATVELFNLGGCRILDAVLVEVPYKLAREADDASDLWTSHLWAAPDPDGAHPDTEYPWQRLSETGADGDPRGGTWHLMDVAEAQGLRLGPQLIGWTAYHEGTASLTDVDVPAATSTSSTFESLWGGSATYDSTEPGWSIATAAYARNRQHCHPYWSDRNGSIPVIVAVYGGGDATAGTVRIQASKDSWVECAVATGTPSAWNFAYGHLRCGIGPGDDSVVQAFMRRDSGVNNLNVHAISVFRADQYAQP